MRIMVFDVPAESGGALSVLHEYYNEFKLNQENEYIFVLSFPELKETSNIKVIRFPWIKKSWGHRLFFDYFVAPRLIKEYEVDRVLSLQNIIIPRSKVHQSVFVHNALPFSEYRFSFNENKLLWVYQNIIGKRIKKSIKKADHIIVQTNWMKNIFIEQLKINTEKIEIKRPDLDIEIKEYFYGTKESLSTFFYPASGVVFKNHKIIVEACLKLKENGINGYKVIFTINGNENEHVANLYSIVEKNKLPIKFIGYITKEKVFEYYSKSILLFPSYIETVGLPLLEAKLHSTPIICAGEEYAKSILEGYRDVEYFINNSSEQLSEKIKRKVNESEIL